MNFNEDVLMADERAACGNKWQLIARALSTLRFQQFHRGVCPAFALSCAVTVLLLLSGCGGGSGSSFAVPAGGGTTGNTSTSGGVNGTTNGGSASIGGTGSNGGSGANAPFSPWSGIIAFRAPLPDWGQSSREQRSNLWYITPEGSKRITEHAGFQGSIRWSPNGQYLACLSDSSNYPDYNPPYMNLLILDRNGNPAPRKFTGTGSLRSYPVFQLSWLPDSRAVLYGEYYSAIWGLQPDGNTIPIIYSRQATFDHNPTSSWDGQWIYFVHHEYGVNGTIYRIRSDKAQNGSWHDYSDCEQLAQVSTSQDEAVQLEPAQDGSVFIAFSGAIYALNPDAKTLTKKLGVDAAYLRSSPDGKWLAVLTFGRPHVAIYDSATMALRAEFDLKGIDFTGSLAWNPNSDALALTTAELLPDGQTQKNEVTLWRFADPRLQTIFADPDTKRVRRGRVALGEGDQAISWTR